MSQVSGETSGEPGKLARKFKGRIRKAAEKLRQECLGLGMLVTEVDDFSDDEYAYSFQYLQPAADGRTRSLAMPDLTDDDVDVMFTVCEASVRGGDDEDEGGVAFMSELVAYGSGEIVGGCGPEDNYSARLWCLDEDEAEARFKRFCDAQNAYAVKRLCTEFWARKEGK
jgi:hypothetical protein